MTQLPQPLTMEDGTNYITPLAVGFIGPIAPDKGAGPIVLKFILEGDVELDIPISPFTFDHMKKQMAGWLVKETKEAGE